MNADDFRRIALSFPEAIESAHMDHPDFRVGGRIFATLARNEDHGVVMLSLEEQSDFVRTQPDAFAPVDGGWGCRGATKVRLDVAETVMVQQALATAWRRRAPKRLTARG